MRIIMILEDLPGREFDEPVRAVVTIPEHVLEPDGMSTRRGDEHIKGALERFYRRIHVALYRDYLATVRQRAMPMVVAMAAAQRNLPALEALSALDAMTEQGKEREL